MPTTAGSWAAGRPSRKILGYIRTRLVLTCDPDSPPCLYTFPRLHQSHDQFHAAEAGFPKRLRRLVDYGPVGGRIQPSGHVPENLFHDALLALRSLRQKFAEFPGTGEVRTLNTGYRAL